MQQILLPYSPHLPETFCPSPDNQLIIMPPKPSVTFPSVPALPDFQAGWIKL